MRRRCKLIVSKQIFNLEQSNQTIIGRTSTLGSVIKKLEIKYKYLIENFVIGRGSVRDRRRSL